MATKKKVSKVVKTDRQPIASFITTEIPLVSFLRYKGYTVEKVEKVDHNKAQFVFSDVDRNLLDMFNSDNAEVEPKMFASIMRQLIQSARRVVNEQ